MDWNFQKHLPADFDPGSRVWVYQSSRRFFLQEAFELEDMLTDFVQNWKSHRHPVAGYANLLFGQFIVIMADERATGVSGCSTDSSVKLIKSIEQKFKVDMFNRLMLAFIIKDKIEVLPMTQLKHAMENNFINADTLYFNNTVLTKKELEEKWIIPLKSSWLSKQIQL
jgi:hypothetical protein